MRPAIRYGLALSTGVAASAVSFVVTSGVVDPFRAWMVTALTGVVYTGFVALYLPVYDQFDGPPANTEAASSWDSAIWGGVSGGAASIGTCGTAVLLIEAIPNRYIAAIGLFVFGVTMLSMAVGMRVVAVTLPESGPGNTARAGGPGDGTPADD